MTSSPCSALGSALTACQAHEIREHSTGPGVGEFVQALTCAIAHGNPRTPAPTTVVKMCAVAVLQLPTHMNVLI